MDCKSAPARDAQLPRDCIVWFSR